MNPLKASGFMRYALNHPHPEFQSYTLGEIYVDGVRQNDKRPAMMHIMVPDEWVKNIRGTEELQDIYIICKYPRELWEAYQEPDADDDTKKPDTSVPEAATDGIPESEIANCVPLMDLIEVDGDDEKETT